MPYLQEFLMIAAIHFLAVASPGPDFAVVLKQSIRYGRVAAIYTSLGIGTGILIHVAYSLVGIGLIIASDERYFSVLKYIAASYFLYIAWHGLRAKKGTFQEQQNTVDTGNTAGPSNKKSFITGFFINGLNVKATLFFVSLFSMVISVQTPLWIKFGYGLYMAVATAIWFCALSYMLSHQHVRDRLINNGHWIERIMGVVLLVIAIELVMSDIGKVAV
ncbi:LysE family translocator [Colwelliaceae bacterium 6471]